jgi:hypothetical protein
MDEVVEAVDGLDTIQARRCSEAMNLVNILPPSVSMRFVPWLRM